MHEKRYRPVPKEVEWVRFIDGAYLETRSLGKTAELANQRGIRSRNGPTLTKDAVSRILRNPVYVGLIAYNSETFKGSHEPISDKKTYNRILESLDRNRRRNGNGKSKANGYDYLLQGLILCGYCSGKMVSRTSLGRGGRPYHYYICSRADKTAGIECRQNYLDAVEADRHVLDCVKELALRDDLVRKLCEDRDASFAESLRALRRGRDQVKEQLAENRRQATNLVKIMARMEGEPPDAMLQQAQEFERERTVLEETLSRMGEEVLKLERTSMRLDLAGKTVRYLAGILDHARVTPDHLKDCLPKFINYVTWRKEARADKGRFEVALFERPFRADRGRLLREVVEDLGGGPPAAPAAQAGPGGNGATGLETHKPRRNDAVCGPGRAGFAAGYGKGWLTGIEPATSGATVQRSDRLSYSHHGRVRAGQNR